MFVLCYVVLCFKVLFHYQTITNVQDNSKQRTVKVSFFKIIDILYVCLYVENLFV